MISSRQEHIRDNNGGWIKLDLFLIYQYLDCDGCCYAMLGPILRKEKTIGA